MFALCMVELSLVHVLVLVLCSALSLVVPVLLSLHPWVAIAASSRGKSIRDVAQE